MSHPWHWGGSFVCTDMSMRVEAPEEQRAFYKSAAWLKCRAGYIKKVGGLCERCFAKGIAEPCYIVHHKEYITPDNLRCPEVALSFDNLEALCLKCHNEEHFKRKRRYEVRADGTVIIAE